MKKSRGLPSLHETLGVYKIADDKSSSFSPPAGTREGFYDKDQSMGCRDNFDIIPFHLCRNKDVGHIYIFISGDECNYLEGKTSTRFYKNGINDNQYRVRYQSESQGENDYCLKSFERRTSFVGFRSKEEAIAFRNLVMDVRNYREVNSRFSKANNDFDNSYPFGESWMYMDNILTSSSEYLLAIPVPDMRKVYEMTLWLSPHINVYAFGMADCNAKYVEVPLVVDKTIIKLDNKWMKRGKDSKEDQPKGAYRVYGDAPDAPCGPSPVEASSEKADSPLHLLIDYHGTPELSVSQLNENTLFELTDTPDSGNFVKKQESRLTTDEIDYTKVFQDPVNLSTL